MNIVFTILNNSTEKSLEMKIFGSLGFIFFVVIVAHIISARLFPKTSIYFTRFWLVIRGIIVPPVMGFLAACFSAIVFAIIPKWGYTIEFGSQECLYLIVVWSILFYIASIFFTYKSLHKIKKV